MASESSFTSRIRKKLPDVVFCRHEDALSEGIPDISYCSANINGWMEMKQVDEWWPVKTTNVHTPFRKSQTLWMGRRMGVGGPMFGLCQVGATTEVLAVGPAAMVWWDIQGTVAMRDLFARRRDVRLMDMRDAGFADKLRLIMKNGLPP
jgi:hypothetical protein